MDYLINSKSTKPEQGVTYFVDWNKVMIATKI